MVSDGLRTCTLCRKRRKGCTAVNDNPAVYCAECREVIRRHNFKKDFKVIQGGKV